MTARSLGELDQAWDAVADGTADAAARAGLVRDLRGREAALHLLRRLRTEEGIRLALGRPGWARRHRLVLAAAALLAISTGVWLLIPGHRPEAPSAQPPELAEDEPFAGRPVAAGDHRLPDGSSLTTAARTDCSLRWDAEGTLLSLGQGRIVCTVVAQEPGRRFAVSTPEAEVLVDGARLAVRRRGVTTRVVPGDRELRVRDRWTGELLAVAVGERIDLAAHCAPVRSAAKKDEMP